MSIQALVFLVNRKIRKKSGTRLGVPAAAIIGESIRSLGRGLDLLALCDHPPHPAGDVDALRAERNTDAALLAVFGTVSVRDEPLVRKDQLFRTVEHDVV